MVVAAAAVAAVVAEVGATHKVRKVRGEEEGGTTKEEAHHTEILRAVVATGDLTGPGAGREEGVVRSREGARRRAEAAGSGGVPLLPLAGVSAARGFHRTRKPRRPLLLLIRC